MANGDQNQANQQQPAQQQSNEVPGTPPGQPGLQPGEQTVGGGVVPQQPAPQQNPSTSTQPDPNIPLADQPQGQPQQAPADQQPQQAPAANPAQAPQQAPQPAQAAPAPPQSPPAGQAQLQPGEVFCEQCGKVLSANQAPAQQNQG